MTRDIAAIDRAFWRDLAEAMLERGKPGLYVLVARELAGNAAEERIAMDEFRRAVRARRLREVGHADQAGE